MELDQPRLESFSNTIMTATARRTLLENNTCAIVAIFCDYLILFAFYNVGEERYNWIGLRPVKLNTEN